MNEFETSGCPERNDRAPKAIKPTKYTLYLITSLILVAVTSALGIYTVVLSRDTASRYFAETWASHAFDLAVIASTAFALSAFFAFKSERNALKASRARETAFVELITVPTALLCAYRAFSDAEGGRIALAAAAIGAVFTILTLVSLFLLNSSLKVLKSYAEIIFCILIIISLYLEYEIEINSPYKLMIQFAAASVILSALAEARLELSRCSARLFVPAKLTKITLCTLCAAVNIVCFVIDGPIQDVDYLAYSLFFASEAICSSVKYINTKA